MARYVRILLFLIFAAFTTDSVVYATNAASMSMKMALGAVDGADMGDCQACLGGNDDALSCDNLCMPPVLAVLSSDQPLLPGAEMVAAGLILPGALGHTGPPDPYPPRSNILS